jgi:serine/threonine protein kinase
MAEVYLGMHLTLERPVAIKFLHSYIEGEPLLLDRFHREAKVVAALRHPNIVQVFDFDAVDGHPFIVMEYLKGPTLATYLSHLHQRKKRIPQAQVARLLNRLADALDYAHGEGVIHRDIKPGNILLHNKTDEIPLDTTLPDDVEPIVTDFGLVRVMNAATQTMSGIVSGTPSYMSPEQARGDEIDHRTDFYSLGAVLYEMLAGRVPFQADNTVSVLHMHIHTPPPPIAGISAKVQAVVDRALAKNPNDRYQTGQEMADDFYRSIGLPGQAEIVGPLYSRKPMPVEVPSSSKPAAVAVSQPRTEVEPFQKTEPPIEPEPSPKSQVRTESAPSPKSQPRLELAPKPARSRAWIGVGLLSLVCLSLLVIGVLRLLPNFLKPTGPSYPIVANTSLSPLPSETPDLPSAEGMVEVISGTYEVGFSPADDHHITPTTIPLNDFWIDKFLATNAQYQQYMTATDAPPPQIWPGEGNHPVIGITWEQALAYCDWANKRLPKEAEWEAAGRGPGAVPQLYPWGNDVTAQGQALKLPDQDTYPVGTQSFNQSPFGVFDMVGNVWEWVGEPYASEQEGNKFLRGGRYGLPINDLAYRLAVAPGDTRYIKYAGFRCAADQVR